MAGQGVAAAQDLLQVLADRIVATFGPDDVAALGDKVMVILETVRDMGRPETTSAEPPSALALANRLRRPDARRGLERLLRLLEAVGATNPGPTRSPQEGTA